MAKTDTTMLVGGGVSYFPLDVFIRLGRDIDRKGRYVCMAYTYHVQAFIAETRGLTMVGDVMRAYQRAARVRDATSRGISIRVGARGAARGGREDVRRCEGWGGGSLGGGGDAGSDDAWRCGSC